jgi:quercetin dioxygenase-like cupin family protein
MVMNRSKRDLATATVMFAAFLLACSILALQAQETAGASGGGAKRTVLEKQDLSVPGREGVLVQTELAPGAREPRHTHPGDILGYVQEGTLTLTVEGKPAVTLQPGGVFFVPAGKIHSGENSGTTPVKLLVSFFVEKGKPLTTPVK